MAGENYASQYERFSSLYQLDYDLDRAYEFHKLMARADDVKTDGIDRTSPKYLYQKTLTDALTLYLERVTSMKEGKFYNTADVSIGEFIDEFEKVMQAKYLDDKEKDATLPERKPFDGWDFNDVALSVWNDVKHHDQPIPDVWADSIHKGDLTIDQILAITEPAKKILEDVDGQEVGFVIDDNVYDEEVDEEALGEQNSSIKLSNAAEANAVLDKEGVAMEGVRGNRVAASAYANILMAKTALDKASEKRTLKDYLNPLNWIPYLRQAWNSRDLGKKLIHYHNQNFIDHNIEETLLGKSLIKGAYQKMMSHVRSHPNTNKETLKQFDEREKNRTLAAEQKKLKEILEKGLSYEEVRDRMEDPALDESVDRQIKSIVEKPMGGDRSRITAMLVSTKNDMRTIIRKCWEAYGNAKDAEKKEAVVKSYAVTAFKRTYDHLKNHENLPSVDRIVVAQKIANVMMKTFSPVAFGENYAKYGDNYVVNHYDVKAIKEATGAYDIGDDLKDIKIELGIEKQPMQLDDDFKEKDVGKAERIVENAPVKDVQKDMQ